MTLAPLAIRLAIFRVDPVVELKGTGKVPLLAIGPPKRFYGHENLV